jgi:hypothetical protein
MLGPRKLCRQRSFYGRAKGSLPLGFIGFIRILNRTRFMSQKKAKHGSASKAEVKSQSPPENLLEAIRKNENDWLRKLYEEGWKQYCHEDNLGQSRTNFFMGIQAGLLAILAAFMKPMFEIGYWKIAGSEIHLGLLLIGTFTLLVGIFSFAVSTNWENVTKAGKQYVNLRWITIAAIEAELGSVSRFGLAGIEDNWRRHCISNAYKPFDNSERLKHHQMEAPLKNEGWGSMLAVIRLWRGLCLAMAVLGFLLMVSGIFGVFSS